MGRHETFLMFHEVHIFIEEIREEQLLRQRLLTCGQIAVTDRNCQNRIIG